MSLNILKYPILFLVLCLVNPFPSAVPGASATPFTRTLQNLRGLRKGQNANGVGTLRSHLKHLGYQVNEQSSSNNFDENVESALKHYQAFHHLPTSGVVDDKTIETMSLPRCGLPDIPTIPNPNPNPNAAQNYSYFPGAPRWRKFALTYRYSSSVPSPLSLNAVRQAMANAFQTWKHNNRFTFTEVSRASDIVYGFHRGNHGDGYPFDGPSGVLAHAFAPQDGRLHYDADERWSTNGPGIDFETVCLHEIGHILGLGHSNVAGAIMEPIYPGIRRSLAQDDKDGLKNLYGF
ncbi:hypothetical protein PHAVU_004G021000 [Phaseolus vulgaris]|uniref:Peptidase metallopeptidase domain-containing protein n=1 Tax=Phaseolus vulgaris TaxID=3885 RepID=V7C1A0_PHAVU|nr:hypothetical protein PHAVU_004G021000g [Phaseolus vulgaris]ESW23133.1 hypothetical protein PHAVU_004G021000g [Phaseolus vulgaris]